MAVDLNYTVALLFGLLVCVLIVIVVLAKRERLELRTLITQLSHDLNAKSEILGREKEELAAVTSAISEAVLAINKDGEPLFYNSRFAMLFDPDKKLSKEGARIWEIFRMPEIQDAFKSIFETRVSINLSALPVFAFSNKKHFFSISVSPLKSSNGDVYAALGIFHDVTELKTAEQIRIDFVANVSHELRTPLTSIKGYTDTLIEDFQEKREIDPSFLQVISRNSDRLMSLVKDLLDLSSLESTDVITKSRINVVELTDRVVEQMKSSFVAKNQSIKTEIPEDLAILVDAKRVEQVITNLLDNAGKYTPENGAIKITWEKSSSAAILKVSDNGPGIPEEHRSRLFERFYRIDKARSRDAGGTGLGLAIVKHIMQRHGGSVTIQSQVGQGTAFVCKFPI